MSIKIGFSIQSAQLIFPRGFRSQEHEGQANAPEELQ